MLFDPRFYASSNLILLFGDLGHRPRRVCCPARVNLLLDRCPAADEGPEPIWLPFRRSIKNVFSESGERQIQICNKLSFLKSTKIIKNMIFLKKSKFLKFLKFHKISKKHWFFEKKLLKFLRKSNRQKPIVKFSHKVDKISFEYKNSWIIDFIFQRWKSFKIVFFSAFWRQLERLNFKRALLLESGRALELARETTERPKKLQQRARGLMSALWRRFLHFLTVYYVFRFFCQNTKKATIF